MTLKAPANRTLDVKDIAWAAGFIDAEGCLQILRQHINTPYVSFRVCATHHASLKSLHEMFGGTLRFDERGSPRVTLYTWRAANEQLAELLAILRPHLRIRGEEADTMREFLALGEFERRKRLDEFVSRMRVRKTRPGNRGVAGTSARGAQ